MPLLRQNVRSRSQRRLQRAPNIGVEVRPGSIEVRTSQGAVTIGNIGLAVLMRFEEPHTAAEVINALWIPEHGRQRWLEITGTIQRLVHIGALRSPHSAPVALGAGFGGINMHARMLDDRPRTAGFLAAIARTVTSDDVVLDIGTGTGVLALGALRAGARRVYAIESAPISAVAEQMFRSLGSDRITLIRGWSTDIELAERATVLVTETIGSELFDERIVAVVQDARARLLTPSATIIPRRVDLWVTAVEFPEQLRGKHRVPEESVARWRESYGFDFSPLRGLVDASAMRSYPSSQLARTFVRLSKSIRVASVDFLRSETSFEEQMVFRVERSGTLDGLVLHFDVALDDCTAFSTDPWTESPATSWGNLALAFENNREVTLGDSVHVRIWRGAGRIQAQPA